MFFILGISQKEKRLNFDQLMICKCCGKYGHIEVFMTYSYFMVFFIPILKWNKRYFVRMNCCGSTVELASEIGKEIEQGKVVSINPESLNFEHYEHNIKHCSNCGFSTNENFQYCPQCGKSFH